MWDLPTRVFHWALVVAVTYAWVSVELLEDMQQHFYAGYTVLGLLLFRIVWGVIGSTPSKFSHFMVSPKVVWSYVRGRPNASISTLSHNPLGALSVIAMLVILLTQAVLGLFSTDDYFYGPLSGLVTDDVRTLLSGLHLQNVNIIYGLLALHLGAILYHQVVLKNGLIQAMISGKKPFQTSRVEFLWRPLWLALLVALICAALVYYFATAYLELIPQSEFDYF